MLNCPQFEIGLQKSTAAYNIGSAASASLQRHLWTRKEAASQYDGEDSVQMTAESLSNCCKSFLTNFGNSEADIKLL